MQDTRIHTLTPAADALFHDRALPFSTLGRGDEPFGGDHTGGRPAEGEAEMVGLRRLLGRVVVRSAGRILALRSESIEWVEAADNYVRLHTAEHVHVARETLAALEVRLDRQRFVRIHRSAIVNIEVVEEMLFSRGKWQIRLHSGERLPVGRTHRRQVRALFEVARP